MLTSFVLVGKIVIIIAVIIIIIITVYLKAAVDKTFVIQLLEHPPNAFHKRRIHGLVVVLEINPTTEPRDVLLHVLTSSNDMNKSKL